MKNNHDPLPAGTGKRGYHLKWGNGNWQRFVVRPGGGYRHAIPYRGTSTPIPYVTWDSTVNDGKNVMLTTTHFFQDLTNVTKAPSNYWLRYKNTVYLKHFNKA